MQKLNMNDKIKVKLTDYGREVYYHQFDGLIEHGAKIKPIYPQVDEDGFTEFMLWRFVNLYGSCINMGAKEVVKDPYLYFEGHETVASCEFVSEEHRFVPKEHKPVLTAEEYAKRLRDFFKPDEDISTKGRGGVCWNVKCEDCPLDHGNVRKHGYNYSCSALVWYCPDVVIELLDDWEKEHAPKGKTYEQDFLEKFPNAPRDSGGLLEVCRNDIYGIFANRCTGDCVECWNEVMPNENT